MACHRASWRTCWAGGHGSGSTAARRCPGTSSSRDQLAYLQIGLQPLTEQGFGAHSQIVGDIERRRTHSVDDSYVDRSSTVVVEEVPSSDSGLGVASWNQPSTGRLVDIDGGENLAPPKVRRRRKTGDDPAKERQ